MKCPYCGKEMKEGYIQCRDGVFWTENRFPISALSGFGKGATSLENDACSSNNVVYAWKCADCKKVIIDYQK